MTKTLSEYQQEIYEINQKNGWFDDERTWLDDIALLHSEVSEAFEAFRSWGLDDRTRALCMHDHEEDSWDGSYCHPNHLCKPQGVGSELADILVRILDTVQRTNGHITIEAVVEAASGSSWNFEGFTFGGDVARLHCQISRLMDVDKDELLSLGLVFGFLKAWNEWLGLDMYWELERKIAYNETRDYRHGNKRV